MDEITDNMESDAADDSTTITESLLESKENPPIEKNTHDSIPVMDYDLAQKSSQMQDMLTPDALKDPEASYNLIAYKIVKIAEEQLKSQNQSKIDLKADLSRFFRTFLKLQFVVLFLLLFGEMICNIAWPTVEAISDKIILTFITSVFVETLGGIILMVIYAFSSKDEIQITKILTEVIKTFQKRPSSEQDKTS